MNDRVEQKWVFFYDVEHIQGEVENITSTIASRPYGKEGGTRSYLMMTEDHSELFRRLIKDAFSDVRAMCYKWVEPEHASCDIEKIDRLHLHTKLLIKEAEGVPAIVRVIDDKVREYLIYKIVAMWLTMKAPEEVEFYLAKVADLSEQIRSLFARSGDRTRRRYHYY
jgi:hypothetical protein